MASQFNVLEMTGPNVSPEEGVTQYVRDRTQGPACAIAAGAATIYRNYFLPVAGESGQTSTRQIDGLAEVGEALSAALVRSVETLWQMRNGYALCHQTGLEAELWPKVGEGVNRGRRHIVGVFEPPLLHRRSDMPCPTITLSN